MHLRLNLVAVIAVALLGTGVGTALAGGATSTTAARVSVAQSPLGRILVDGRGHTLYLFEKDTNGKSACSGVCVGFWPPLLTRDKPLALAGAKASLLGTTRRADGRLQVTYNHHPLYTFFEDKKKGQTKGEGLDDFGAEWYAVSASGAKVEKGSPSSSSTGNDASRSGGYSY